MLLLCTDMDRTLLPNGIQPESPQARHLFARLVSRGDVALAYVTGRHLGLVERAIANYALPRPDYIVSDVGTRIYRGVEGGWQPDAAWEAAIDADWRGRRPADLNRLFADLNDLRLQGADRQNAHKLSYFVPLQANRHALLERMQERLAEEQIQADLIFSIDEPAGVGLLDVLPASATKLHAVEYLRDQLALDREQVLFAGDSGNDLPVLASAVPAVLVANASAEVRDAALKEAGMSGHIDQLYLARGGALGMNGNYSAGILEGVGHFHPDLIEGLGMEPNSHVG